MKAVVVCLVIVGAVIAVATTVHMQLAGAAGKMDQSCYATPPQDEEKKYGYIATQLDREDQLINVRLTWILTSNGFLFAALAFVHGKEKTKGDDVPDTSAQKFFHRALPILGFVFSASGLIGVISSQLQERYLMHEWTCLRDPVWPRPYGGFPFGGYPALAVPVALTIMWVLYGVRDWKRR
jgi:hypothetical protein